MGRIGLLIQVLYRSKTGPGPTYKDPRSAPKMTSLTPSQPNQDQAGASSLSPTVPLEGARARCVLHWAWGRAALKEPWEKQNVAGKERELDNTMGGGAVSSTSACYIIRGVRWSIR